MDFSPHKLSYSEELYAMRSLARMGCTKLPFEVIFRRTHVIPLLKTNTTIFIAHGIVVSNDDSNKYRSALVVLEYDPRCLQPMRHCFVATEDHCVSNQYHYNLTTEGRKIFLFIELPNNRILSWTIDVSDCLVKSNAVMPSPVKENSVEWALCERITQTKTLVFYKHGQDVSDPTSGRQETMQFAVDDGIVSEEFELVKTDTPFIWPPESINTKTHNVVKVSHDSVSIFRGITDNEPLATLDIPFNPVTTSSYLEDDENTMVISSTKAIMSLYPDIAVRGFLGTVLVYTPIIIFTFWVTYAAWI